jgi:hypothetical protein
MLRPRPEPRATPRGFMGAAGRCARAETEQQQGAVLRSSSELSARICSWSPGRCLQDGHSVDARHHPEVCEQRTPSRASHPPSRSPRDAGVKRMTVLVSAATLLARARAPEQQTLLGLPGTRRAPDLLRGPVVFPARVAASPEPSTLSAEPRGAGRSSGPSELLGTGGSTTRGWPGLRPLPACCPRRPPARAGGRLGDSRLRDVMGLSRGRHHSAGVQAAERLHASPVRVRLPHPGGRESLGLGSLWRVPLCARWATCRRMRGSCAGHERGRRPHRHGVQWSKRPAIDRR